MTDADLNLALRLMRPWLRAVGAPLGPRVRATRAETRRLDIGDGFCCPLPNGGHLLLVDSHLRGASALSCLLHEAVHAAVGWEHGHRGRFLEVAHALGMDRGTPADSNPGPALTRRLRTLARLVREKE